MLGVVLVNPTFGHEQLCKTPQAGVILYLALLAPHAKQSKANAKHWPRVALGLSHERPRA